MSNQLPDQYPSWYVFWLAIKELPEIESHKIIRVAQGHNEFWKEDNEVEWLTFNVDYIKSKAFDEVESFLPVDHDELSMLIMSFRLAELDAGPKWYKFHELLNEKNRK